MTMDNLLSFPEYFIDYGLLEEQLQKIDSVEGNLKCDFLCLATNTPQSLGQRLTQSFTVTELESFLKEINQSFPATKKKWYSQAKRNAWMKIGLSIVGLAAGIFLVKTAGDNDNKFGFGLALIIGSIMLLGMECIDGCSGQTFTAGKIKRTTDTIKGFGIVVIAAQESQAKTAGILSKTVEEWYNLYRSQYPDSVLNAADPKRLLIEEV